jgi:hypothetical protein
MRHPLRTPLCEELGIEHPIFSVGFGDWPRYAVGAIPPDFEGDFERVPMFAGESCDVVKEIRPAAEIVRDLVRDAEAALN